MRNTKFTNKLAIDSKGVGEALTRSAASLAAANNSVEESIALISATNRVIQNPEKVGTMWNVVAMRIRGAKAELEEAGEETEGVVESTSKLRDMILGMTGFDILMPDGKTFKSTYDIILGIGEVWNDLSDLDQAALLETLAGKRQANALAATLNNLEDLRAGLEYTSNAEGTAVTEHQKWMQSIEFSEQRAKAAWEEFSTAFIGSDLIKFTYDAKTGILGFLTQVIKLSGSAVPLIGSIFTGIASGMGNKGFMGTFTNENLGTSFGFGTAKYRNTLTVGNVFNSIFQNGDAGISGTDALNKALAQTNLKIQDINANAALAMRTAKDANVTTSQLTAGMGRLGVGATAASVGMKALAIAGNMLLSWGVMTVINLAIQGISNFVNKTKNLISSSKESVSAYESQKEEVTKLEDKLADVNSQIDEINKNPVHTVIDDEALENLERSKAILERDLEVARELQNIKYNESIGKSVTAGMSYLEEGRNFGANAFSAIAGTVFGESVSSTTGTGELKEYGAASRFAEIQAYISQLEVLVQKRDAAWEEYKRTDSEDSLAKYKELDGRIDSKMQELASIRSAMDEFLPYDRFTGTDLTADQLNYNYIYDIRDSIDSAILTASSSSYSEAWDKIKQNYADEVQSIGEYVSRYGSIDLSTLQIRFPDLYDQMQSYGWTDEQILSMFKDPVAEFVAEAKDVLGEEFDDVEDFAIERGKAYASTIADAFALSNINLARRPKVSAETMHAAGYTDFPATDYATLYSQTYTLGKSSNYDIPFNENLVINITPITPEGDVIGDENAVKAYIQSLIDEVGLGNARDIFEADRNSQKLIMGGYYVADYGGLDNAKEYAVQAAQAAHDISEWVTTFSDENSQFQDLINNAGVSVETLFTSIARSGSTLNSQEYSLESLTGKLYKTTGAYEALTKAVDEQKSAGHLSLETVQALIEADGNFADALEWTGKGYTLNTDKVYEYVKAQDELTKGLAIAKLIELRDTLQSMQNLGLENTTEYSQIETEIQQYETLIAEIDNATDAYIRLKQAKDSANTDSEYSSVASMYSQFETDYKRGKTGTDEFQAMVDYALGEGWQSKYDGDKDQAYKDAAAKLKRYVGGEDETKNLDHFITDLEKFGVIDKNGTFAEGTTIQGIAEKMGISEELVRAMLGLAQTYSEDLDLTPIIDEEDQNLAERAQSVQQAQQEASEIASELSTVESEIAAEENKGEDEVDQAYLEALRQRQAELEEAQALLQQYIESNGEDTNVKEDYDNLDVWHTNEKIETPEVDTSNIEHGAEEVEQTVGEINGSLSEVDDDGKETKKEVTVEVEGLEDGQDAIETINARLTELEGVIDQMGVKGITVPVTISGEYNELMAFVEDVNNGTLDGEVLIKFNDDGSISIVRKDTASLDQDLDSVEEPRKVEISSKPLSEASAAAEETAERVDGLEDERTVNVEDSSLEDVDRDSAMASESLDSVKTTRTISIEPGALGVAKDNAESLEQELTEVENTDPTINVNDESVVNTSEAVKNFWTSLLGLGGKAIDVTLNFITDTWDNFKTDFGDWFEQYGDIITGSVSGILGGGWIGSALNGGWLSTLKKNLNSGTTVESEFRQHQEAGLITNLSKVYGEPGVQKIDGSDVINTADVTETVEEAIDEASPEPVDVETEIEPANGETTETVTVDYQTTGVEGIDAAVQAANALYEEGNAAGLYNAAAELSNASADLQDAWNELSSLSPGDADFESASADLEAAASNFNSAYDNLSSALGKSQTVNVKADVSSALKSIKNLSNQTVTVKVTTVTRTVTSPTTTTTPVGMSDASGTRNAKGGTTLVDERGAELIEHVSDGTFELGTNNGPRLTTLDKGDIVHTASDTRNILKRMGGTLFSAFRNGLDSAKSILFGDSFATGVSGIIRRARTTSSSSSSSSNKKRTTSTSSSSSSSKKTTSTKKISDYTEKLIDWIEVRLTRLQEKTDQFLWDATQAIGYIAKNNVLSSALKNVNTQIDNALKGMAEYQAEAEFIQKKYNLDEGIAKKIREGTIQIGEYGEDTRNKINAYKEWWDKAEALKSTLRGLYDQQDEIAKQRLQNIVDYYDSIVEKLEDAVTLSKSERDLMTALGKEIKRSDFDGAVADTREIIAAREEEYKNLKAEFDALIASEAIEEGSANWNEYANQLNKLRNTIVSARIDLADLMKEAADVPLTNLGYLLDSLNAIQTNLEGFMDLHEVQGIDHTPSDYQRLISNGMKQIANLEKQNAELKKQQKNLDVLSERYQELQNKIDDNNESILDIKHSQEEWNDAILDLRIAQLQDYKDSIEDVNTAYEEQKKLQEALIALDKARTQRTVRMYREGQGFTYEANRDDLKTATENLDDTINSQLLSRLDDLIERMDEAKKDTNIYDAAGNLLGKEYVIPNVDSIMQNLLNSYGASSTSPLDAIRESLYRSIARSANNGSLSNTNISIGDIIVEHTDDATSLAQSIIAEFPNALLQAINK